MNARINPALQGLAIPISTLVPDPNNARKHSERNIQAISDSLMKFGQQKPVVARGNVVIAGNGTLEAAKRLGWTELAVIPFDIDKKLAASAYALADNRTAELAEWDFDVLSNQLNLFENQMELGYLWSAEEVGALKSLNQPSVAGAVGLSPEEKKAVFDNSAIKQIVCYFDDNQYKDVLTKFRSIAEANQLATNTEVVLHLLTAYENTRN